ncbi:hypothetical protein [Kineococcus indalonis]|uniref:hypothetical protein n=1 Tax=Kineococcus indalonis TaxID=2696566 RepID=UPI001411D508|nr:hypothetical protein [Kineococcus indalonis]NAZ85772.1 hypothetical protein [Kineococcus indalonis]
MSTHDLAVTALLVLPPLLGPLAWFFGADSRASNGWTGESFTAFERPDRGPAAAERARPC